MRPASLLFVLLPLLPLLSQAQPADTTEVAIETPVVVTATRLPADARATGHHVTVLTAEQVRRLPVHSLDGLLRAAGGVEVRRRGGFGVQSDFTLRGASFDGVLLLLDGARLNDPMTGHFLTDLPVPLAEVARVEVVRGPAAAAYGPDAVGGVVHLLTWAGLGRIEDGAQGEVTGAGGTAGTAAVEAAGRGRRGETAVSLGGQLVRSDGEPIAVVGGAASTDFARGAASAALRHRGFYARAGYDRRDFGAVQFYTPFASDTAREATQTLWAQARLEGRLGGKTTGRLQLSGRVHDDEYVFNPQVPANEHTSRRATLLAKARRAVRPGLDVAAGLTADLRGISSNNLGEHQDPSGGVFATAQAAPAVGLALAAGLRLDADPGFGVEPTGTASLAFTPSPLVTLRAAGGRAVRAPTYVERYFNTVSPRPNGNLGNPALRAERAWTAETGADLFPLPGLTLRATGFLRDTENLIDYARLSAADTVFLAQNVLGARTLGAELDARLARPLGAGTLTLDVGYAYLDTELSGERPGAEYKYALTHARHRLAAAATFAAGVVTAGVQGFWKERLDGERLGVLDARLGVALPVPAAEVALTAEVHNLLDEEYAEVFGAPMPGRRLLVGARVRAGG